MERNRRILIVDDQQDLREQLAKLLLRSGKKNETSSFVQSMRDRLMGKKDENEPSREPEPDDSSYEVMTASQGEEAFNMVEKANEDKKPFAVMFTDMRMPPGWDGLETSKKIRGIDKNLEIVIMTAYADHDQKTIAETVGTPEKLLYIKKPFQSEEIYQLALSLTSKWNFEATERKRKGWLETVIRSMSKVKTATSVRNADVYATALKSIQTFTDSQKGMIAAWNYNLEEWEMKYAIGIDEKEASDFTREHSERLFESRTTQTYEGKYLLPLKREGYSAIVVLYDVVPKSDPEWYKLLSLLGMTVSEVLSFSCSTADVKRQDEFSSLSIALSKISNECKTHLKELLDYADMLKNVLDGNKDNSKLAEGIINSARFMVKQMDDILLYTGKGVADFSKLDIKKIAEEAAKELNPPEIDLAVTVSGPEKAEVSGNEKMLKTLFTCLAGNSAQAAESAGMEKVDFEIKITLEDKKFILRITDNGPGIPVDIRKKLFEPFSVSGEKKGRLGIGLALCRQIAEAHRGNISYDINYDSGARFKIKIPAFSDDES